MTVYYRCLNGHRFAARPNSRKATGLSCPRCGSRSHTKITKQEYEQAYDG